MYEDFEELIKNLQRYENELKLLYEEYNPNDSGLKMEMLAMKMSIIFYNYSIDCLKTLNTYFKEKYTYYLKKYLTAISYLLTGITVIKAPIITIPSLMACLGLSIKNKVDGSLKEIITEDQYNQLLDLMDSFENSYTKQIDNIFEQVDKYEDDEVINNLNEPEKSQRMACKKLMQFLREESDTFYIENDDFINKLKTIIENCIDVQNDDFYVLLQQANDNYQNLNQKLVRLDKKNDSLYKLFNFYT